LNGRKPSPLRSRNINDEPGVLGWNEIEHDVMVAQRFEDRLAEALMDYRERVTRSLVRGQSRATRSAIRGEESASLQGLSERSCAANQLRCATLQHLEATIIPGLDHGILIGLASQIVETELDRLVTTPALTIASNLIEALQHNKDREPAEILESWAARTTWTVLGVESIVFLALRRGCDQGIPAVLEFLEAHFLSNYRSLVQSKMAGQCLDYIRNQRNAVVHKGVIVDTLLYEAFIRRVVGHRRFALWEQEGPCPASPGPEAAILHHHLQYSRIAAATAKPVGNARLEGSKPGPGDPSVEGLLALEPIGPSLLDVHVVPLHAGTRRVVRGMTVSAHMADPPYVLGDMIRFRFQTNRPCHVVLIDVGTTGETSVLWPNAWHPDTWIDEEGDHFLPSLEQPECDFTLTGVAGTERIVAIATLTPLQVPLLPEPGAAFRCLTTGEVARLVDELKRQSSGCALSCCSFQVQPS
jgi:hypothetical protein